jgi:hypothetical protein
LFFYDANGNHFRDGRREGVMAGQTVFLDPHATNGLLDHVPRAQGPDSAGN